jgi:small subunit ribosomal protein S21
MRLESAPACDSVACSAIFKGRHRESAVAVNATKAVRTHQRGVYHRVAEVKIQEGESIESALRRFKRKVQQEDIIKDIKKHSFYLKPGDKRRAKQALARKRNRKKLRRESE